MFLTLLAVTFVTSLTVCFIVDRVFTRPLDSIPGVVIARLLGSFALPVYHNRATWRARAAVYAGSVLSVSLLGLCGAFLFFWLSA